MPPLDVHLKTSKERTGKEYEELHRWIDEAFVTSSSAAMVAEFCKEQQYGAAMGTFGTIYDIGHASGPIMAGLLLAHLNYQHSFLIIAAILIAASFVFALAIREKKRKRVLTRRKGMKKGAIVVTLLIFSLVFLGIGCTKSQEASPEVKSKTQETSALLKSQQLCPVIGDDIEESSYVDYNGKRIYVCCEGCVKIVRENPKKYLQQLESEGIRMAEVNDLRVLKYTVMDFEGTDIGKIPEEWKVEATNQRGPRATWGIASDTFSGRMTTVLGMLKANGSSGGTFNICWTDNIRFKDGEIEVGFKAIRGSEDQGGGPMWRVQDAHNYYIARANPLEDNFRVYYVKDGRRKQLDSARVKVPSRQWHTIKIVHKGNKIEGYLNGRKYLDCEDATFQGSGGIGLWTKADAVTNFNDLKVLSISIGDEK